MFSFWVTVPWERGRLLMGSGDMVCRVKYGAKLGVTQHEDWKSFLCVLVGW